LLRLQSDERLIGLIRRGQHAAFETLFSRYQSRLLAFCRHMLGSKEDAEDVLQEVFAAAFNAILADNREINVRPWLYRIARNRSLNHLRKASAIGVDSMDVHYAEGGLSTAEKVMRRESFRQLIGDVQQLPETQRTALLLREIDALSYEQISESMETTVPAVKSLLVRARISLAEAAEARKLTCDEARLELGEVAEGLLKTSPAVRRHVRDCERCRTFRKHLKDNNVALAAMLPVGPLLLLKKLVLTKLGSTAGAGHVAGAGGAGAAAGAGAVGGAGAGGGFVTAGVSALATKAVAGLAVAAIVTASTVEAGHVVSPARHHHHPASVASVATSDEGSAPVVTNSVSQPLSASAQVPADAHPATRLGHHPTKKAKLAVPTNAPKSLPDTTSTRTSTTLPVPPKPPTPPVTEVTTESTQLPSAQAPSAPSAPAEATTTATTTTPPPATPTTTTTTTTQTTPSETPTTTTTPPTTPTPEGGSTTPPVVGVVTQPTTGSHGGQTPVGAAPAQ
jgi:RNA polymerase sigma factor (sigma-70 family)